MPSPSLSSFHSYSNSSSPTADLVGAMHSNSNNLLLRCFSPSSSGRNAFGGGNGGQNYFSKSPSPTRKLFVARRSMSPVPGNLRPSSLTNALGSGCNSKRKYSDVEQNNSNESLNTMCSPKRFNQSGSEQNQHHSQQQQSEFVEPLLIFTGNNNSNNSNNNANMGSNLMQTLNR